MISVSFDMMVSAVIFSLFLGFFSSILYCIISRLVLLIYSVVPKKKATRKSNAIKTVIVGVIDFSFVTSVTVISFFGNYIRTDGLITVYSAFALVLSYCLMSFVSKIFFSRLKQVKDQLKNKCQK